MKVRNEEELGKALKNNVDLIEVEYDLKRKVVRIRAINDVAWMVCIAAMTVGVASIIATAATAATAGTTAPVNALVATPALAGAVTVMGVPTTISAVGIAVAGGGVASLNKLRNYKVKSISGEKIQLIRK